MSRLAIALVVSSLTLSAYAQDSLNMVRHWQSMPSGPVKRMVREGDVLYAAVFDNIVTYDVSIFSAPQRLGSFYVEPVVYDFAELDRQVFVIGNESLTILDATSPNNLERIGAVPAFGNTIAIDPEGAFVVIGDYQQFNIFDVSDPSDPWNIAAVFNTLSYNVDIAAFGDALYVLTSSSLQVWDVSVPNDPLYVDSLLGPGMFRQCADVIDDTLYVLQSGTLHVFDLTFPLAPVEIGGGLADNSVNSSRIAKADTMLIMAGADNQICFASIADLSNPVAYEPFQLRDWPRDVIAEGRQALFGLQADDFYLIDFANPEAPVVQDTVSSSQGSMAHIVVDDVVVTGQFRSAGLWTADLSDLNNVTELDRQFHYPWYAEYAVSGNILAAAPDSLGGFDIFEIEDAAHPVFSSNVRYEATPFWDNYHNDIAVFDHFVIAAFDSVVIFDVSNPLAPIRVFSGLEPAPKDLAVQNGTLWVLGEYDVRGYTLDDPAQPAFIGGYSFGGTRDYRMIAVDDTKLYLAGQGFVQGVDITDPMSPMEMSGIGFWATMKDIDAQNEFLAVGGYDGIDVVSYHDPFAPVIIAHHYDNALQISLNGNQLYGSSYSTFNVYGFLGGSSADDRSSVTVPSRLDVTVYPNPFNPSTTIAFDLVERTFVALDVYDINGRHVAGLLRDQLGAGAYHVNFNAQGLPSGAYFARVKTPSVTKTARITLVR